MNISVFNDNSDLNNDSLVKPDVVQNRFGSVYGSYTMLLLERDNG